MAGEGGRSGLCLDQLCQVDLSLVLEEVRQGLWGCWEGPWCPGPETGRDSGTPRTDAPLPCGPGQWCGAHAPCPAPTGGLGERDVWWSWDNGPAGTAGGVVAKAVESKPPGMVSVFPASCSSLGRAASLPCLDFRPLLSPPVPLPSSPCPLLPPPPHAPCSPCPLLSAPGSCLGCVLSPTLPLQEAAAPCVQHCFAPGVSHETWAWEVRPLGPEGGRALCWVQV